MKFLRLPPSARSGSAALEFALIGPLFLGLLLAVLELGFLLYAQTALDYCAKQAGRQLQTGLSRANSTSQSGFRSDVFCPIVAAFLDCSRVVVSIGPVANYQTVAAEAIPMVNGQINSAAMAFDAGQSGSLMLLRAYYTPGIPTWPLNIPVLVGTAAFRNEF
jgi:Flp pilus assembly protein TadG